MSNTTNDHAEFTAYWGDSVIVSIEVNKSDWNDIVCDLDVRLNCNGFFYDGNQYLDFWDFKGGLNGKLEIKYTKKGYDDGDGSGVGYLGSPNEVLVKPLLIQEPSIKLGIVLAHENSSKIRQVKIIVKKWPDGTMAMKFGSVLQTALGVSKENMELVEFKPQRIFNVMTSVSEDEFRKKMKSHSEITYSNIKFIEIK